MIYRKYSKEDFVNAFAASQHRGKFTYDSVRALYDWLNSLNRNIELDITQLCIQFKEYPNVDALVDEFKDEFIYDNDIIDEFDEFDFHVWLGKKYLVLPVGRGDTGNFPTRYLVKTNRTHKDDRQPHTRTI